MLDLFAGATFDSSLRGAHRRSHRWQTFRTSRCGPFPKRPGCGIEGIVAGHEIWMGSAAWLASRNVAVQPATGGRPAAWFMWRSTAIIAVATRSPTPCGPKRTKLIRHLSANYELALLSGDNEKERERFRGCLANPRRSAFQPKSAGQAGLYPRAAARRARP